VKQIPNKIKADYIFQEGEENTSHSHLHKNMDTLQVYKEINLSF